MEREKKKIVNKDWSSYYDISKKSFIKNLDGFKKINKLLSNYDIDIESFDGRIRIKELANIANAIKHGEGWSFEKLKGNNILERTRWVSVLPEITSLLKEIKQIDDLLCGFRNFIPERSYAKSDCS